MILLPLASLPLARMEASRPSCFSHFQSYATQAASEHGLTITLEAAAALWWGKRKRKRKRRTHGLTPTPEKTSLRHPSDIVELRCTPYEVIRRREKGGLPSHCQGAEQGFRFRFSIRLRLSLTLYGRERVRVSKLSTWRDLVHFGGRRRGGGSGDIPREKAQTLLRDRFFFFGGSSRSPWR